MKRADRLHIVGTDAATGEPVERWTAEGRFVDGPVAGAVELGGWTLPGLVDAHCHIGYSMRGAVDLPTAERQARDDLAAGVLLIRDCGSPIDTSALAGRDDLPVLIRAGRHIARPKRYIRDLGVDLDDPADLPAEVARQIEYGSAPFGTGWIKLVGDWIDRDIGDLAPLWPDDVLAEAIAVAHGAGVRVTAHVFAEDALPGLLAAGIDCIEHGTGLTPATIDEMVRGGVHLVPTLINIENFPDFAEAATRFPAYAKHMRDLYERRDETFAMAVEAGIAVHAGTDAGGYIEHGRIADEVAALAGIDGLTARQAMDVASHRARAWLGAPVGGIGDPADLVVYPADPAEDLAVLKSPLAVIRAGVVRSGSAWRA
ncbi:amidohydrolase family protein [Nakamurella lactea]|uniref:amidohydrolase family protein n=1 Tax=Nakamurella lactea TaxID=459515 RepID=UPI0006890D57|nr:amidohydrolase family protein [Nakamurella lactea]